MPYYIVLVSAIYQHDSAIGIGMSPPSWTSFPPPYSFWCSGLIHLLLDFHIFYAVINNIILLNTIYDCLFPVYRTTTNFVYSSCFPSPCKTYWFQELFYRFHTIFYTCLCHLWINTVLLLLQSRCFISFSCLIDLASTSNTTS